MNIGRNLRGVAVLFALTGCGAPDKEAEDPVHDTGHYFPPEAGDWGTANPQAVGWDANGLEAALVYAQQQRSSGVVVLVGGRIIAERYWEVEADPEDPSYTEMTHGRTSRGQTIEDVASIQKSVISFLAGVAEAKGRLDLEAPVSQYIGQGWSKASAEQEQQIKVRHLLSMASGLSEDHSYQDPAGEVWMYNTPVYSNMVQVLESVTGLTLDEYTSAWLTSRIGMKDSRWLERAWYEPGIDANRYGFATSARDLARFGLLILASGHWAGEDLLENPTYLERALSPSQQGNTSYGYLWWLNGGGNFVSGRNNSNQIKGPMFSSAPDDMVAALGVLGRKCYVVPSLDLVVTRLGDNPHDEDFSNGLFEHLMKAAPR